MASSKPQWGGYTHKMTPKEGEVLSGPSCDVPRVDSVGFDHVWLRKHLVVYRIIRRWKGYEDRMVQ